VDARDKRGHDTTLRLSHPQHAPRFPHAKLSVLASCRKFVVGSVLDRKTCRTAASIKRKVVGLVSAASRSSQPVKIPRLLRHEVIMTTQIHVRDSASGQASSHGAEHVWRGHEFHLPACVRLNGEQVIILPTAEGIGKFALRIEDEQGELRALTRDEELVLAVTPGTPADQAAAIRRVDLPEGGLQVVLLPQSWQQGDLASVLWQLQQRNANGSARQ
jgi:hypothetical protein